MFAVQISFYKFHSLIKALLLVHPTNTIIYLRMLKKIVFLLNNRKKDS